MAATANLGFGGVTLVVLTLICWLLFSAILFGVAGREVHGDATVGNALAWFAAMGFAGLTWLWIGGLLLKAGTQDVMPNWVSAAAVILYFASGAAVAAAFYLVQKPGRFWPVIIPVLLPPILAFYIFALYQSSLRQVFSGSAGSLAVWGAVLALTLAPWPALVRQMSEKRASRIESAKAMEEWQAQEKAKKRAENLEALRAMKPEQPLTDWYNLLDESSGVQTEAIEALKHVERRQGDIEEMLTYGILRAMMLVPDLDLNPTPQLCEAARAYLLKNAKGSRIRPKQDPVRYTADGGTYLERSLTGVRWLQSHGCNCEEGLAAVQASVETYLDSPDRQKALAAIAELRKKP